MPRIHTTGYSVLVRAMYGLWSPTLGQVSTKGSLRQTITPGSLTPIYSALDTTLGVYTGTVLSSLTLISANNKCTSRTTGGQQASSALFWQARAACVAGSVRDFLGCGNGTSALPSSSGQWSITGAAVGPLGVSVKMYDHRQFT